MLRMLCFTADTHALAFGMLYSCGNVCVCFVFFEVPPGFLIFEQAFTKPSIGFHISLLPANRTAYENLAVVELPPKPLADSSQHRATLDLYPTVVIVLFFVLRVCVCLWNVISGVNVWDGQT